MAANPQIPIRQDEHVRIDVLERAENYRLGWELESQEPPCSCRQTDVDLFDARGCELHDRSSWWNVALLAVTPLQRLEEYNPAESADCLF